MKISALIPKCGGKVEFSRRELPRVPESPGCYALSNYRGDILYVGQTGQTESAARTLRVRMGEHLDAPDKTAATTWGAAFWFHYLVAARPELNRIETGWVRQHEGVEGRMPPLNKRSPPAP